MVRLKLYYFIFNEQLLYVEGEKRTTIKAVSGGGRGQVHHKTPFIYGKDGKLMREGRDWRIQAVGDPNNADAVRGGPIPPEQYEVGRRPEKKHDKFGRECAPIYLTMLSFNVAVNTGRVRGTEVDGKFFFHGRGQFGSDGCIVPVEGNAQLRPLLDALDRNQGGVLRVVYSAKELKKVREDDARRADGALRYMRTA